MDRREESWEVSEGRGRKGKGKEAPRYFTGTTPLSTFRPVWIGHEVIGSPQINAGILEQKCRFL